MLNYISVKNHKRDKGHHKSTIVQQQRCVGDNSFGRMTFFFWSNFKYVIVWTGQNSWPIRQNLFTIEYQINRLQDELKLLDNIIRIVFGQFTQRMGRNCNYHCAVVFQEIQTVLKTTINSVHYLANQMYQKVRVNNRNSFETDRIYYIQFWKIKTYSS